MSVVRQWLPPKEAEAALAEEPYRFNAIFAALKQDWESSAEVETSSRCLRSLRWLSLVKR